MARLDLRDEQPFFEIMERYFAQEVCAAATSRAAGPAWRSAVRCQTGRGRRSCGAYVEVARSKSGEVRWSCARCGCGGTIVGYEGGSSDLSAHVARGKLRNWGFDEQERDLLHQATGQLPALRAVVMRAGPHPEVEELLLVRATVHELDEMYSLVETLEAAARSRKTREMLFELRRTLSTSIDGF